MEINPSQSPPKTDKLELPHPLDFTGTRTDLFADKINLLQTTSKENGIPVPTSLEDNNFFWLLIAQSHSDITRIIRRQMSGSKDSNISQDDLNNLSLELSIAQATQSYELIEKAGVDPLTGAFNRRSTIDQINNLQARMSKEGGLGEGRKGVVVPYLFFWDIDHFHDVNELTNHVIGDKILRKQVENAKKFSRSTVDRVGRYGGDELTLTIVTSVTKEEVDQRAEATRQLIQGKSSVMHEGKIIQPTISLAVVPINQDDHHEEIFARASKLLLQAKKLGRNCTVNQDGLEINLRAENSHIVSRELSS
ncbi:GGDEF domain-containing protein [Patescibacteria group bacterium]